MFIRSESVRDLGLSKHLLSEVAAIACLSTAIAAADREKANWHVHNMTFFALDKPIFHELSPEQGQAQLQKLVGTFGKIIIKWNPDDKVPAYTPQIVIPDSPFMLNNTK
jgi:hypothetical protein